VLPVLLPELEPLALVPVVLVEPLALVPVVLVEPLAFVPVEPLAFVPVVLVEPLAFVPVLEPVVSVPLLPVVVFVVVFAPVVEPLEELLDADPELPPLEPHACNTTTAATASHPLEICIAPPGLKVLEIS